MRVLVLWRQLDPVNPLEAIIQEHPTLSWHTVGNNLGRGKQAMVMRFHGSPDDLGALRERYLQRPPAHMEFVKVLRETRTGILLFAVERSGVHPLDISVWIQSILGPETVVSVRKAIDGVTWHILTANEARIPAFLEKLKAMGIRVERQLLRKISHYEMVGLLSVGPEAAGAFALTPTERAVLESAIRMGFYEQPKHSSIAALARELKMPRSTAHYHLKRAEEKVLRGATEFLL